MLNNGAEQKYQNNTQLFPGSHYIPASFVCYLLSVASKKQLARISPTDKKCHQQFISMETVDCCFSDVRELGH